MDFTLVLIVLFSLGVTVEALRAKIDQNRRFRSNAVTLTRNFFQVEGVAPTNYFCTDS